jgi:hypothetical protein
MKQQISSSGRSWDWDLKPVAHEFNQEWKALDQEFQLKYFPPKFS